MRPLAPSLVNGSRLAALRRGLRDLTGAAPDPLAPQWPIYLRYVRVRLFVALALVGVQALLSTTGSDSSPYSHSSFLPATLYALQTLVWLIVVLRLEQQLQNMPQTDLSAAPPTLPAWHRPWLLVVGSDLLFFSWLYLGEPSIGLNHAALFVLPVLMAGLLMPRSTGLVTSTLVVLILWAPLWGTLEPFPLALAQIGRSAMISAGVYLLGFLAQSVAQRTLHERAQVQVQRELVRQQALLNAMVIGDMDEGVLVVDAGGAVHSANPAARILLGHQGLLPIVPFDLAGQNAWTELYASVKQAFEPSPTRNEYSPATQSTLVQTQTRRHTVTLHFTSGLQRALAVRIRIATHDSGDRRQPVCVVFMEDHRTELGRHRQERLATMGRFSAGIAHEIRNPLAAISQANQLLHEDLTDPVQLRLSNMVAANVSRLRRIVDDVMETAADQQQSQAKRLLLAEALPEVLQQWQVQTDDAPAEPTETQASTGTGTNTDTDTDSALRSGTLAADLVIQIGTWPVDAAFWFDPEHFRRVCVNLLDNAWRHCRRQIGSVQIRVHTHDPALPLGGHSPSEPGTRPSRLWLDVASDGPPIPPSVQNHLFEPFYSTRSRGTGLGLYLCKELCDRHGAQMSYLLGEDPVTGQALNVFRVSLRVG